MVEQTIEQRGDGGGVAEELTPIFHGAIRRHQRGRSFIAAPGAAPGISSSDWVMNSYASSASISIGHM